MVLHKCSSLLHVFGIIFNAQANTRLILRDFLVLTLICVMAVEEKGNKTIKKITLYVRFQEIRACYS